ncbi:hypothetical protein HYFRA_00014200, partial [Hymenoscyphus fraxineus]
MPPSGGQGAATALEDAETLAYAFTFIFSKRRPGDPEPDEILSSWQDHRIERVKKIAEFTSQSSALRKPSSSRLQRVVKEFVIRMFFMVGRMGRGKRWLYGYDAVEESFDRGKGKGKK